MKEAQIVVTFNGVKTELKRGDSLSPVPFNLALDKAIREL